MKESPAVSLCLLSQSDSVAGAGNILGSRQFQPLRISYCVQDIRWRGWGGERTKVEETQTLPPKAVVTCGEENRVQRSKHPEKIRGATS